LLTDPYHAINWHIIRRVYYVRHRAPCSVIELIDPQVLANILIMVGEHMMTVIGQAVLNPPVRSNRAVWDLLISDVDQQESKEDDQTTSTQPDQPTIVDQDPKPSIEDLFESLGYRIGSFLKTAAQGVREVQLVNPNSLNQEAIPEVGARPQLALQKRPGGSNSATYRKEAPQPALGVNGHIRSTLPLLRPLALAYGEGFGAALQRIYDTAALKFPLKSLAKFCIDQLVRSHTARVVLGGVGILGLGLKGSFPSISEIGEQVIEVVSSFGEYALGLLISPSVAQIVVAFAMVLALLLYRRHCRACIKAH
jgi:hypothetical protein